MEDIGHAAEIICYLFGHELGLSRVVDLLTRYITDIFVPVHSRR